MKLQKRFVKQSARNRSKYGFRPHYVYDWTSEDFWGCVQGNLPALRGAQMENAGYMNGPGHLRTARFGKRLKEWSADPARTLESRPRP